MDRDGRTVVNGHWWECDGATGGRCLTPAECAEAAAAEAPPPVKLIDVLRLEPGDVLVVKVGNASRPISEMTAARIREKIGQRIPGHEILIMAEEYSIGVVRP